MSTQKDMFNMIKRMSGQGNVLTIQRLYIDLMGGDIVSALFLSQVIYWSDKGGSRDGWFYKKHSDWHEELGMSKYQVMKAADDLEKMGIIQTKIKKADGSPTKHYLLMEDVLIQKIVELLDNQKNGKSNNSTLESEVIGISESEKTLLSLTETTTEITTEITNTCAEEIPENLSPSQELSDEDKENAAWFEANAKPAQPRLPLSSDEHKANIQAALESNLRRQAGMSELDVQIHNFIQELPENMRDIAQVFCREFGRIPLPREKSGWITAWHDQVSLGLSKTNIEQAMRYMQAPENNLSIKWPGSVTALAEKHKKFGTLETQKASDSDAIFKKWQAKQGGEDLAPGQMTIDM